ncbi:Conserved_hypothetical protein [Hexamita inflata]|uniref:Uncharacterized protein n=1 Tax=Hexamita inflata TaxID=28002 RepID=A0AA86N6M2_9EUKA|nr:Conserved hypothetical protein [Hexamita inflata]
MQPSTTQDFEDSDQENQRKVYLTEVQVGLARHEINDPSGAHNTELEQALENFKRVSEELKKTQHEYEQQKRLLDERREVLDRRQGELKARQSELTSYGQRQKERDQQTLFQQEQKRDEILQQLNEVSGLVDQIAGATALLHALKSRNQTYKVYSEFVQSIYQKLNGTQADGFEQPLSQQEKMNKEQIFQQNCLEAVGNRFQRLQKEEVKSQDIEMKLNAQYDQISVQLRQRTMQNRATVAQLEQKLSELSLIQDQLNTKKELYNQDNQVLNLKLHEKTQELSNVQSAIKNLMSRIAEMQEKEDRQKTLAERARIEDMLRGENPKLEKQTEMYYQRSKGLVDKEECKKRVVGKQLMERMRDVYKLGIFLKDMQDLVRLCHGEKIDEKVK